MRDNEEIHSARVLNIRSPPRHNTTQRRKLNRPHMKCVRLPERLGEGATSARQGKHPSACVGQTRGLWCVLVACAHGEQPVWPRKAINRVHNFIYIYTYIYVQCV